MFMVDGDWVDVIDVIDVVEYSGKFIKYPRSLFTQSKKTRSY